MMLFYTKSRRRPTPKGQRSFLLPEDLRKMPVNTNPGIQTGPQLLMELAGKRQQLTALQSTGKMRVFLSPNPGNISIIKASPWDPENFFFKGKSLDLNFKKKYS
jgi:hypothetical protein